MSLDKTDKRQVFVGVCFLALAHVLAVIGLLFNVPGLMIVLVMVDSAIVAFFLFYYLSTKVFK